MMKYGIITGNFKQRGTKNMKKRALICIIGGSGSGKSTLEDEIVIHDGFSKVISTTTRKKRDGEHNGREYHFVDIQTFKNIEAQNELLESIEFSNNFYGLTKSEFNKTTDNLVFVVEPHGFVQISNYIADNNLNIETIVVFMNISEKERFKNMVKRGDSPISIQDRLQNEKIVEDFNNFGIIPNIAVTTLNENTHKKIMNSIIKIIEQY